MGDGNPTEGFTVRDRRHHAVADEDADRTPHQEPASMLASPGPAGGAVGPAGIEAREVAELTATVAETGAGATDTAPDVPVPGSLDELIYLLATLAGTTLERDVSETPRFIDLLTTLRAKTSGNRTPAETDMLDGVIHELQTAYISVMDRAGRGPGRARP